MAIWPTSRARDLICPFSIQSCTIMGGPSHHLDGEEEGEEGDDDNPSPEIGKKAVMSEPSTVAVGSCEDALVNNMKRLNIEREEVNDCSEDDEDDECLLQTLTIQVSRVEKGNGKTSCIYRVNNQVFPYTRLC